MRTKRFGKFLTRVFFAVVLAGLSYSASVLMPKSVYAATCVCNEENQDAAGYCLQHFGRPDFALYACPLSGNRYQFLCVYDPNQKINILPCD